MDISADIELLFEVSPAAFHPPPKVDSAVLRFVPHDRAAELGIADRLDFLRFVALCFRQKRKILRNNLAAKYGAVVDGWPEVMVRADYPQGPHDQPQSMCPAFGSLRVGLRMRRVAEQIGIPVFAAMYRRLVT